MSGNPLADFELPYTSYAPDGQNGRINFASTPSAGGLSVPDSAGFAYPTKTEKNFMGDMLRGNLEASGVSKGFFTAMNVTIIQAAIKRGIYEKSGSKRYVIDDQDVDELKMIMRAIYLQYSQNNIYDIEGQISDLNKLVIDWCVPRILSEINQHLYYLNDISHLPIPMMQPISMSSAGTKSLAYQSQM